MGTSSCVSFFSSLPFTRAVPTPWGYRRCSGLLLYFSVEHIQVVSCCRSHRLKDFPELFCPQSRRLVPAVCDLMKTQSSATHGAFSCNEMVCQPHNQEHSNLSAVRLLRFSGPLAGLSYIAFIYFLPLVQ